MRKTTKWSVYILKCGNGCLYTGITNDLKRRLLEHSTGKGAKYTRAFGVEKLVYWEVRKTMSSALKREAEIKSWNRSEKLEFIRSKKLKKYI